LLEREKSRQWRSLELIASENFTSQSVLEFLGSTLANTGSDGLDPVGSKSGSDFSDQIEKLCQKRALNVFGLNDKEWGVNVQPYSGSFANFAVYTALLPPHSRIMGLDLPSGGHMSHGYYTYSRKEGFRKPISSTSKYFETFPYSVNSESGLIDFDGLQRDAGIFKPALLITGGSAYPRDWDYRRFREIADTSGSLLMMDMSHISGLIATGEQNNPFDLCDIVTTTTNNTLRGPKSGMIFYRKEFEAKINMAVYPGLQDTSNENVVAAVATQLKEVQTPRFKLYCQQIKKNATALVDKLKSYGYIMATDGTDNHLILWDLRTQNISGTMFEKVCDAVSISLSTSSISGDDSSINCSGVRIGTPALTSRKFIESDFEQIGEFLHEALQIAIQIQETTTGQSRKELAMMLENDTAIKELASQVQTFAVGFPMPSFDVETMRYNSATGPPTFTRMIKRKRCNYTH
jgi:glycine hydroxymethyltransferase